jgi:hypothetical protein
MTEEMSPTKGQLLEQQSAEERIAFAAYKETYEARVPRPKSPAKLDLSGLGFEFWLYFSQAITSILLAAMRTSDAFYFVGYAVSSNAVYATGEALLSVLVVELGMVVFAAILAKKRYERQEKARKEQAAQEGTRYRSDKTVDINSWVVAVGLGLMALISMAAGLHQSVRIIENVSEGFVQTLSYGLGVAIGIGITVIAVIAGDILGQQLAIITAGYADRAADYEEDVENYQSELEDAWARSDERRVIRAEVRAAARSTSVSTSVTEESLRLNGGGAFGTGRRPAVNTERVYQYMDQILSTENRIPSYSEVQQVLGLASSTASTLRKQWMAERGVGEAGSNGHGEA